MYIVGIDYSMNSPGVVKLYLDDVLEVIEVNYLGFSSVKKVADVNPNITFYHAKNSFKNNFEKCIWMRDNIFSYFMDDLILPDFIAIEGYAFNAQGIVFDIAESTMCTKLKIYESNIPLRIYDPNSIKKFATSHGNSGKVEMVEAFDKYTGMKPDYSKLPELNPPKEDLVDAFWTAKLLQIELKLRHGLIDLKDLPLYQIEIFNRVTKKNKENLLVQPFVQKD
jgi:hypothetical protein